MKDIPLYAQRLCNELVAVIRHAPSEELEAIRQFLINAAKATVELQTANFKHQEKQTSILTALEQAK